MKEKQTLTYQKLIRELDKFENDATPSLSLSTNSISFPGVQYMIPLSSSFEVCNDGQVIANYRFVGQQNETKFCKRWLWVNPSYGMLLPNQKMSITVTVLVDNYSVYDLNMGNDAIEDILIFRVENGKDQFIEVCGNFLPTSFGIPLEILARIKVPLRHYGLMSVCMLIIIRGYR